MIGTTNVGGKRSQGVRAVRSARALGRRIYGAVGLTQRAPQFPDATTRRVMGVESAFDVDRVANWSAWKTQPDSYLQANYDSVRLNSHTEGRHEGIKQRSERFIEPNQGWSVELEYERAADLKLGVHHCLDFYHGSGRPDDDGSHCGPGRYHFTWAEGGMRDAINDFFSWRPENCVSFSVGNEPRDVDWLANQYDQFWMSHARAKCNQAGIPLVGYDGNFLGPMFAKWCDWIDVHAIGSFGGRAAQKIKDARRLGLPVVMFEFSARKLSEYDDELLGGLNQAPLAMGAFPGSPEFPNRGTVKWNFKQHVTFNHTWEKGTTDPGDDWSRVLGESPTDPPDPPIEPPEPPIKPPPDDSVNLNKVRVQNQKAIGALEKDPPQVNDALGILRRQAKTLGI